MGQVPLDDDVRAELDAMDAAYERAAKIVDRAEPTPETFALAKLIGDHIQEVLLRESSFLRARTAARIRQARSLSLGVLAKQIGVSRARAQQYIDTTRGRPASKEEQ